MNVSNILLHCADTNGMVKKSLASAEMSSVECQLKVGAANRHRGHQGIVIPIHTVGKHEVVDEAGAKHPKFLGNSA